MKLIHHFQDRVAEVGERLLLSPEDAHHCVHVLRLSPGEPLTLSDGTSWIYRGTLEIKSHPFEAALLIQAREPLVPPQAELHLHLSPLPKPIAEDVVYRAAEWGVTEIHWTYFERSETFWEPKKVYPRWEKLMQEAVKAVGRPRIPTLNPPVYFNKIDKILEKEHDGLHLFGHTDSKASLELNSVDIEQKKEIHIWIGPKGDFTTQEIKVMLEHRFVPTSIGNYIYRIESAAFIFMVQLQAKLGGL